MDNKLIRYCIYESGCRLKFSALVILIIAMIGQSWFSGGQQKRLSVIHEELTFVDRIDDMEEKLKTRARLEAFKEEKDGGLADDQRVKISGFAIHEGAPAVIVDGMVYTEGGAFGEYVIVRITEEMITLVNKETNAIKNLYVFEE